MPNGLRTLAKANGRQVIAPMADFMLAPKLETMRTLDAAKGANDTDDIFHLMRAVRIDTAHEAMQI